MLINTQLRDVRYVGTNVNAYIDLKAFQNYVALYLASSSYFTHLSSLVLQTIVIFIPSQYTQIGS